ncbi:MAG: Crp/Fnr family transcriptional regulator [Salinivirgaceae bacterium]|jgi:CRP-like cAMP-binding protein|nr:Crp/Fnr family transcriptional regulator [Salinivirgaceae bacterium]
MQHLTEDDLKFLDHKKKQLLYLKGENIFKQGAFAPYVMYIQTGLVKVYLQTGYEKQVNIRIAKAGDFLAFSSIFGEDVYTYSSVAINDAEICMIDKEGLRELLFKNNEFAMRITTSNYKNENHLLKIISSISYKQMRGKLATALIYLSSKELLNEKIFQLLTRNDIADFASISTESAIKFLKEFEKEGILKLDGKDIIIEDYDRLNLIAKSG